MASAAAALSAPAVRLPNSRRLIGIAIFQPDPTAAAVKCSRLLGGRSSAKPGLVRFSAVLGGGRRVCER